MSITSAPPARADIASATSRTLTRSCGVLPMIRHHDALPRRLGLERRHDLDQSVGRAAHLGGADIQMRARAQRVRTERMHADASLEQQFGQLAGVTGGGIDPKPDEV